MESRRPRIGQGWSAWGRLVFRVFCLSLLVQVAMVAVSVWGAQTFGPWATDPGLFDLGTVRDFDRAKRALQVVGLATNAVGCLVLSAWVYRAHRSDRMRPDGTEHWAGWAFIGWVVPPFCLFMPYGIIRDVRRGAEGDAFTRWPTLAWWWTTFLLGMFVGMLSGAFYAPAVGGVGRRVMATAYAEGATADAFSGALLAISLVLLLAAVRTLARAVQVSPPVVPGFRDGC